MKQETGHEVDMLGRSFGFKKKRMAQPQMVGTLKQSLTSLLRSWLVVLQVMLLRSTRIIDECE
jgi:hypothetical protein